MSYASEDIKHKILSLSPLVRSKGDNRTDSTVFVEGGPALTPSLPKPVKFPG